MSSFIAKAGYTGTILAEPLVLKSFNLLYRAQLWYKTPKGRRQSECARVKGRGDMWDMGGRKKGMDSFLPPAHSSFKFGSL